MQYKEYHIEAIDGKKLFVRKWIPDQAPFAILYLIHGFSEHSGRYTEWAKKFTQENLQVYAMDYRGHGKAEGFRGHTPTYKYLLDDIDILLKHDSVDKGIPRILYGQSLGGNMVLNYELFRKHQLAGIIVTSPWLRLVIRPKSITVLFARILRILAPKIIKNTLLDINALSHDPQVAIDYEKDPLTHSNITPQLFFGAENAARKALKKTENLTTPLLLMHGTADLVTSYKASKKFAQKAENLKKDITFISWEGLYHELHNEIGNQEVFFKIMEWINHKILR